MGDWSTLSNGQIALADGSVPVLTGSDLADFQRDVLRWTDPVVDAAARTKRVDGGARIAISAPWELGTIWAETRGRPQLVSADGGYGLGQLTSHAALQGHTGQETLDDPVLNIDLTADYIAFNAQHFNTRDLPTLAAAYNAGSPRPSTANRWGYVSTGNYIDRVVAGNNTAVQLLGGGVSSPSTFRRLLRGALFGIGIPLLGYFGWRIGSR